MRLAWAGACVLALATASPALGAAPSGARSCTGCHSPAGPGAALEGRPAAELAAAMAAFRSGAQPSTVMGRIAKGFSDAESQAIAAWFAAARAPGAPRAKP